MKMFKIILIVMLVTSLISCSKDVNAKEETTTEKSINIATEKETNNSNEKTESLKEVTNNNDDVIKSLEEEAKKLALSPFELEAMIHELSLMEATKHNISIGDYLKNLEENGQTAFEVQKLLADTLDMTLTELFDYQVYNEENLTEEQKENNKNISDAVSELNNTGLTGESKFVDNMSDVLTARASKIIESYDQDAVVGYIFETDDTIAEIAKYYSDLLEGTSMYSSQSHPGSAFVTGTLNDKFITAMIEEKDGVVTVDCGAN